jgi:hypothetical protein
VSSDYHAFLASKHKSAGASGFDVAASDINPALFPFQREVVRWALKLGKAALFEERGLGKTIQELEWAFQVSRYTGKSVLILAPLAVAFQFLDQAATFGYTLRYVQNQAGVTDNGLYITNYDRLAAFDLKQFGGGVIDESSILKAFTGATKQALVEGFKVLPYRLAGTATPAPNDPLELGNHAEFLGVMPSNEMIARWFINDTMKAGVYRLKKHAAADYWRWLTSFAVCLSKPRDLGDEYDMPGFDLPALNIHEHLLKANGAAYDRAHEQGLLLPSDRPSSTGLHAVKRESLSDRVDKCLAIVDSYEPGERITMWCDTNYEADALKLAFPDALEVRGSHSVKIKEERLRAFTNNEARMIITKPDIAGMGLNWQHCRVQVFAGLSFSFEKWYQAIGRSYRYGQTRPVDAHMVYAETEANVLQILQEKQSLFTEQQEQMTAAMREHGLFRDGGNRRLTTATGTKQMVLPEWLYSHESSKLEMVK